MCCSRKDEWGTGDEDKSQKSKLKRVSSGSVRLTASKRLYFLILTFDFPVIFNLFPPLPYLVAYVGLE